MLRKYLGYDDDMLLLLGPRRIPPVVPANPNTPNAVTILTSVGYRHLKAQDYIEAVNKLQPDIAIGMADIVLGKPPGVKRRERMVDRTHAWTQSALEEFERYSVAKGARSATSFFAPIVPLEKEQQTIYLQDLEEEMKDKISGLAVFDASTLTIIPDSMSALPRLSLEEAGTPQEVLRGVSLGADLTTIPFISVATDAGFALDFTFPAPDTQTESGTPLPLAFDMWPPSHSADMSPLVSGCQCYTCKTYHRAYIRHLLNAKEMLAWTLLQVHNHHTVDNLFAGIRQSIANGTLEKDIENFERVYETDFPEQSGPGPRYVNFPHTFELYYILYPYSC